jgi:hypothetical protein
MTEDHFMGMNESNELVWLPAWRCINCGEVLDTRIIASRALKTVELKTLRRRGGSAIRTISLGEIADVTTARLAS